MLELLCKADVGNRIGRSPTYLLTYPGFWKIPSEGKLFAVDAFKILR
jgi:hypothetical protein